MKLVTVSKNNLKTLLPIRTPLSNKTAGGKCLIIAGSKGLWGACYLSAIAASRVGAGYIYLPDKTKNLQLFPDFLSFNLTSNTNLEKFAAILFGPGLRVNATNQKIFKNIEKNFKKPVIIDAGGLSFIKKLKPNWIITPHEGELSKLIGKTSFEIRENRLEAVQVAQKKFGGIIVLKGHQTLIATKTHVYKIKTGNKALAKAGTGDVLSGMIVGFLSQGLSSENAVKLACGLHGDLADQWVLSKDYLSLMPSDLLEMLPQAIFSLRHKNI